MRLYSPGHALAKQSLVLASEALRAYTDAYGPLALTVRPGGVSFDFSPQPYGDEVVMELARAMRAGTIGVLRFLHGVSSDELGTLVDVLHFPRQDQQRGGGAGRILRERGVHNVAVEDITEEAGEVPSASATQSLRELLATSPDRLAAYIERASAGDPDAAVQLLREADRMLAARPRDEREAGWRMLGVAVLVLRPPLQQNVATRVLASLLEPWASSIASQWQPTHVSGLLPPSETEQRQAVEWLRALQQQAPGAPIPQASELNPAEVQRVKDELVQPGPSDLRRHATRRLVSILPRLDPGRFEECLSMVERAAVSAATADEFATLVEMVGELSALVRTVTDARAKMIAEVMPRVSAELRQVIQRAAAVPYRTDSPLPDALRAAAAALVRILWDGPLHEAVEVKRDVIYALGRLGTDEARAALEQVLMAEDPTHRRALDELKQEATRALQTWRERRP